MTPLKPTLEPEDFKTAAEEVLAVVPFAFREGSPFEDDVLAEQHAD